MRLGMDYVDLFQIHRFVLLPPVEETSRLCVTSLKQEKHVMSAHLLWKPGAFCKNAAYR